MKRPLPLLLVGLLWLGFGMDSAALAQLSDGQTSSAPHRGGNRRQAMMQELGLNEQQMQALKTIREQAKANSQPLKTQLRSKQQGLQQYLHNPQANESTALAMQQEIQALQSRLGSLRIKTWFQIRNVMPPEALAKMQELRQQRRQQRGGGGMHRGWAGRRGGGWAQHGEGGPGEAGFGNF
ncbi:MAG: periplasmic heavy metal sensor [Candidatus Melainabacteria bacterium]|nr:periplasmic heavy metal sensor [Candidatus Melainabacteria bacterium]